MSLIESIFYMMWRGVAIGILISAPMGPVGILCIQRTLDKGRKTGLYTGVGAALSDLFYCLLTGFGLSFIEEFLERNSNIIQLLGSLVLIAFSVYLFKKNPTRQLKKSVPTDISPHKSILGGFLFTFSNPLILFLIIGLFARFNFLMPEIRFYHYFIGFIFILAGALGWWWIVTFFIDKVRAHFNLRSMWLINRIIGGVILIFAIVGIVSAILNLTGGSKAEAADIYLNPRRGFSTLSTDSLSSAIPLNAGTADISIDARIHASSGQPWQLSLADSDGDSIRFSFRSDDFFDGISDYQGIRIEAFRASNNLNPPTLLCAKTIPCNPNLSSSFNLYHISRISGHWHISAGVYYLKELLDFDADPLLAQSLILQRHPDCNLKADDIIIHTNPDPLALNDSTPWSDLSLLEEYLSNSYDYMEGYWLPLDRVLNESLLRMGGNYRFAMVKSLGGYDLIYLDGASVESQRWHPGAVKAHLSPSGIEGIWDVKWIDAQGLPLQQEIKAQRTDISTLTIQFPYQSSQLRLQRIR